ncbi:Uncharacterised protein [Bordetella pertussis]|nr:Uncharacterised protein [Bordetella pertussis]
MKSRRMVSRTKRNCCRFMNWPLLDGANYK